jgi:hypothetical protein
MVRGLTGLSTNSILEIQLFLTSKSANFDANIHTYTPADYVLSTLSQLRNERPHLKRKVALVESQLARACIQVLVTTRTNQPPLTRDHRLQYCRIRLTMAVYTSSTVSLKNCPGTSTDSARLQSWKYDEATDAFSLTLETDEKTRVQKLMKSISIYSQRGDDDVKLSSVADEVARICKIDRNIPSEQNAQVGDKRGCIQAVSNMQTYLPVRYLTQVS